MEVGTGQSWGYQPQAPPEVGGVSPHSSQSSHGASHGGAAHGGFPNSAQHFAAEQSFGAPSPATNPAYGVYGSPQPQDFAGNFNQAGAQGGPATFGIAPGPYGARAPPAGTLPGFGLSTAPMQDPMSFGTRAGAGPQSGFAQQAVNCYGGPQQDPSVFGVRPGPPQGPPSNTQPQTFGGAPLGQGQGQGAGWTPFGQGQAMQSAPPPRREPAFGNGREGNLPQPGGYSGYGAEQGRAGPTGEIPFGNTGQASGSGYTGYGSEQVQSGQPGYGGYRTEPSGRPGITGAPQNEFAYSGYGSTHGQTGPTGAFQNNNGGYGFEQGRNGAPQSEPAYGTIAPQGGGEQGRGLQGFGGGGAPGTGMWQDESAAPPCNCGLPTNSFSVKKEGPNKDRVFFKCAQKNPNGEAQCSYFQWADEPPRAPGAASSSAGPPPAADGPPCICQQPSVSFAVKKEGPNTGRIFFCCSTRTCQFFQWADEEPPAPGPPCRCNVASQPRKVAKDGPNKGRPFFVCPHRSCDFFQWGDEEPGQPAAGFGSRGAAAVPTPARASGAAFGDRGGAPGGSGDVCYKCNGTGHWARDCPNASEGDAFGGGGKGGRGKGRSKGGARGGRKSAGAQEFEAFPGDGFGASARHEPY